MKIRHKEIGKTALVVVLAITLTIGLGVLCRTAQAADPIKVGVLYSTTGNMAPFAGIYHDGALLAIEQVNKAGGINGRPIEVVDYDAESNPEVATRKAMKMVQSDGVVSVIGPGTAYVFGGMISTIEKLETPFIGVIGTLEFIKPVPKWMFSPELQTTNWFVPMGAYMKQKGIKNFVTLSSADRVGEAAKMCSQILEKTSGVKFLTIELRPISDTEFTTVWAKLLKEHNPEAAVILATPPSFTTPAFNNLYELGFKGLSFYIGGGRLKNMMKGISKVGGENMRMVNPKYLGWDQLKDDDPDKERVQSFAKAFIAKYNKDPEIAAFGYDSAMQILDSIKAVGPDRAKIRDYMENMKGWKGALGLITNRTPDDHAGNAWNKQAVYSWDADQKKFKIVELIEAEPYVFKK
ncbi:MAG: ABC transporter substrate-binding protein [Pseudomonadota bacterium]